MKNLLKTVWGWFHHKKATPVVVATAAHHANAAAISLFNYRFSDEAKIIDFIRNFDRSFFVLAWCHYNYQIMKQRAMVPAEVAMLSNEELKHHCFADCSQKTIERLAANYFCRNRANLVRWWTENTLKGKLFFSTESKCKLDAGMAFNDVFTKQAKDYGFNVYTDSKSQTMECKWNLYNEDTYEFNTATIQNLQKFIAVMQTSFVRPIT